MHDVDKCVCLSPSRAANQITRLVASGGEEEGQPFLGELVELQIKRKEAKWYPALETVSMLLKLTSRLRRV